MTNLVLFSIKQLIKSSNEELFQQAIIRSILLSDVVSKLPNSQQFQILNKLYQDTTNDLSNQSNNKNCNINQTSSLLSSLCTRHSMVIETVSEGYLNCKSNSKLSSHEKLEHNINKILNLQESLSIVLEQLLCKLNVKDHSKLLIDDVDINDICQDAKFNAITLAEHQESWSPAINITIKDSKYSPILTCIPSRIKFVLLEVMKNSLHSSIKKHKSTFRQNELSNIDVCDIANTSPTVFVSISTDENDITVTTEDNGVGIPKDKLDNIFRFLYSSSKKINEMINFQATYQPMSEPLQGLGAGMCLSNIYASQFGGKLSIVSKGINVGCVVKLQLPRSIDITENTILY